MLCSQRTEDCKSQFKFFLNKFLIKILILITTLKTVNTKFFVKMYAIDTDNGKSMVEILWLFSVMFATEIFFCGFWQN
jgi:hypothetical protein